MVARTPQLLRVAFTHVNRLNPALLPADYDSGSIVAVEPVIRGQSLGRLSRLKPPLSAAGAIGFGHTSIVANPRNRIPQANCFRAGKCNPAPLRPAPISPSIDSQPSAKLPRNPLSGRATARSEQTREARFKANGEIDFFGEHAFIQPSGAGGTELDRTSAGEICVVSSRVKLVTFENFSNFGRVFDSQRPLQLLRPFGSVLFLHS
jgi:hypothetical protein